MVTLKFRHMKQDEIFKTSNLKSTDFKFDNRVVNVFDDMVVRSVPFYMEMQRMMAEIVKDYAQLETTVYDLGCSTGTTFLTLDPYLDPSISFTGIDNSEEMLKVCRQNLEDKSVSRNITLIIADLNEKISLENASVAILSLTLQFIRPLYRFKLLQSIHKQINKGGIVILFEKILAEDSIFNRKFIDYYYNLKRRNSYDEMEISGKREALENVLIPYKVSENIQMLKETGFQSPEIFFKWYNFTGIVAVKQ